MKSKYFMFTERKEYWFLKKYYRELFEQSSKYKVLKYVCIRPSVLALTKISGNKYKATHLHVYKKGDTIAIL